MLGAKYRVKYSSHLFTTYLTHALCLPQPTACCLIFVLLCRHCYLQKSSAFFLQCAPFPHVITSSLFSPHTDFLQKKTIGAKEETGFTEGCLANPIMDKSQVSPVNSVYAAVLAVGHIKH